MIKLAPNSFGFIKFILNRAHSKIGAPKKIIQLGLSQKAPFFLFKQDRRSYGSMKSSSRCQARTKSFFVRPRTVRNRISNLTK
jgi:hypothetical protein